MPSNGSSIDYRIMPYVGNGHVATVIFSDSIYMNGLYNGENGSLYSLHYLELTFLYVK